MMTRALKRQRRRRYLESSARFFTAFMTYYVVAALLVVGFRPLVAVLNHIWTRDWEITASESSGTQMESIIVYAVLLELDGTAFMITQVAIVAYVVICYTIFLNQNRLLDQLNDHVVDSPYFLGFAITLTSLSWSFVQAIDVTEQAQSVFRQAGIALSSSLIGLFGRQFLKARLQYIPQSQEKFHVRQRSSFVARDKGAYRLRIFRFRDILSSLLYLMPHAWCKKTRFQPNLPKRYLSVILYFFLFIFIGFSFINRPAAGV